MFPALPQKTLNKIASCLSEEEHALRSLSLVERRLTDECQGYLFSSVRIDGKKEFSRWCDATSQRGDTLSKYVRVLHLRGDFLCTLGFLQDHLANLRAFTHVEHLRIGPLDLTEFEARGLALFFGHFSTIRSIYVRPEGSQVSFINFLKGFPLLETTVVASPSISKGQQNEELPTFVYRGDLVLRNSTTSDTENIFSCFTQPMARPRRLALESVTLDEFFPLEQFLKACGGSLESLHFVNCLASPSTSYSDILLSPLTELRDVTLSIQYLGDFGLVTILSSITSTKISSVTLTVQEFHHPAITERFISGWAQVDDALCRLWGLGERPQGSTDEIGVNVQFVFQIPADVFLEFVDKKELLPRFRERGRVHVEHQRVDMSLVWSSVAPKELI